MSASKGITRRGFLGATTAALGAASLSGGWAEQPPKRRNLLFIMTDQQRFDALSCMGNTVLQTPNLDRLAREGVLFETAYTMCPVSAPARSTMLTGHDVFATGVPTNNEANDTDNMPMPTFDNLLSEAGYWTGYVGKWHCPRHPHRTYDYFSNLPAQVQTMRERLGKPRELTPGEQYDITFSQQPYVMDPLDRRFGWTPGETRTDDQGQPVRIIQPDCHGRLDIPASESMTALQAKETIEALRNRGDAPFTLTCSLHFPHSPILPTDPYYNMYPAADIPLPATLNDPMHNSPYEWNWGRGDERYRSDDIRYMISNYYGLVREIDDWVGKILDTLLDEGLEDNTLVIFTSDHGEMLGSHGMREKNVFYEESAHIPLIMRLPGVIDGGRRISQPVSHVDLFATILDYLGEPIPENHGRSLRPLLDESDTSGFEYVVQEWPVYPGADRRFTHFGPNYMVRTAAWKFMFASTPESTALDGLYYLPDDPFEEHNLLGTHPRAQELVRNGGVASQMKDRLVAWLEHIGSADLAGVKARPLRALDKG